jgi:hypothetical protein
MKKHPFTNCSSVRDASLSADPLTEPLKIVELVERHTDPNAPPEVIAQIMSRIIGEVAMELSDDDLMIIGASNARKLYCAHSNFESCKEHAIALTNTQITHRERVAMSLTTWI